MATDIEDHKRLSIAYLYLCNYRWKRGQLAEAKKALSKVEDHLSFIRHPQIEAFYFMEQGIVYQEEGTYDRAISSFLKALAGYKALRDSIGVQKRLNNIGMGYWRLENLEKALEHYLQALDMAEQREDETEAATILGNIALVYKAQKEYDQALDHYQRSMAI